jgi:hypothetical protein
MAPKNPNGTPWSSKSIDPIGRYSNGPSPQMHGQGMTNGVVLQGIGSPLFVIHSNSKVPTFAPKVIQEILSGNTSGNDNCIVIPVPLYCTALHIHHRYISPGVAFGRPRIRVYGSIPLGPGPKSFHPQSFNSNFFHPLDLDPSDSKEEWIALREISGGLYDPEVGEPSDPLIIIGNEQHSAHISFDVTGCHNIICAIEAAAADCAHGQLVGRFTS